jgi:hypothetical protein
MEINNTLFMNNFLSNDIIILFKPIEDKGIGNSEEAERTFLLHIIKKAIEDLQYLKLEDVTPEQRYYGRTALVWLFLERENNIENTYSWLKEEDIKKIQVTTFDHICSLLELSPTFLRKMILEYANLEYLKPLM